LLITIIYELSCRQANVLTQTQTHGQTQAIPGSQKLASGKNLCRNSTRTFYCI